LVGDGCMRAGPEGWAARGGGKCLGGGVDRGESDQSEAERGDAGVRTSARGSALHWEPEPRLNGAT